MSNYEEKTIRLMIQEGGRLLLEIDRLQTENDKLRKEVKSLEKEFPHIGECKNVGKGWLWRCSECKCRLDIDRDFLPTMWVDGVASTPKFCPNCGKKVVDNG